MLKPAIRYKHILEQKFSERLYSNDYAMYDGSYYWTSMPEIKVEECRWQWAIIDDRKESEEDSVVGYLAYRIDTLADRAYNFGLYSFDQGNMIVMKDLFNHLEELYKNHHAIEWRAVSTNHARRSYEKFCLSHNGYITMLHDISKDLEGNYYDSYTYEIINPSR